MKASPVNRFFYETEQDKVGGVIVLLLGGQGAGKTIGLWNKAIDSYNRHDAAILWRGQDTCQWIGLTANHVPVTIWKHECISRLDFFLTGDRLNGIDATSIKDIESMDGTDIRVKTFSDAEDLVHNLDMDRVNVYYMPGSKSADPVDRYFNLKTHADIAEELNNRDWGNPVKYLIDEIGDVVTRDQKQPLYPITEFKLPEEVGNFRKNGVSLYGTGHDTSDIHYKLWKVKANTIMYMMEAKIKKGLHPDIDQQKVNGFDRGQFIIPGFEKEYFKLPHMPHETIPWIDENPNVRLRARIEATIPNIVPENETAEQVLEEGPLDADELADIIDAKEAADILDVSNRQVRRRINKSQLEAILVGNKYIMSRQHVEQAAKQG